MNKFISWVVVSCCLVGCGCFSKVERKITFKKTVRTNKVAATKKASQKNVADDYITVWIHGINLFKPNEYNLGLWPAYTFIENENLFGIGKHLVKTDPVRFPAENVLMYSWAGKFNYEECEKAAARLYEALLKTISDYVAHNKRRPKIRVVTFSYGGNIALNLAKFKVPQDGLVIDELVILAWPVQQQVVSLAKNPMFKKIFNVYSPLDIVQIIDPQGFYCRCGSAPLFSCRRMTKATNLLQAKIHINGRGCGHFGLNNARFAAMFPMILDELNDWFGYSQEHDLGLKRTRYVLSIYTEKNRVAKRR